MDKRKPGRPANPNKEAKQDIHLWLPDRLAKSIDAVRGSENRTEYILRVLSERPEITRLLEDASLS